LTDGLPESECLDANGDPVVDANGNPLAHCAPDPVSHGPTTIQHGPGSTHHSPRSTHGDGYTCSDPGCLDGSAEARSRSCWPGYLQYNGLNHRMPDTPENHGCDGAATEYDVKCDMWYVWSNCKDLEEDGNVTIGVGGIDAAKRPHWDLEITTIECDSGRGAQWIAAMRKYLAGPDYLIDFPPPTSTPTPKPTATTAAPTPKPTAALVSDEESNCRLEAMAALTVWLISVLQ